MSQNQNPFFRLWAYLSLENKELVALYFFAVMAGLIQLSLPLGIQAIINFMTFNTLATTVYVLVAAVVLGVLLTGWLQIRQLQITETIQQRIFVRNTSMMADHLPKVELKSTDGNYLPELTNRFFETINLQKGVVKLLLDVPGATVQILFGIILLSLYHVVFLVIALLLMVIAYTILRLTSQQGLMTSIEECSYKYKVAGWLQEVSRNLNTFKNRYNAGLHYSLTDDHTQGYLKFRTKHFRILQTQYWTMVVFKVLLIASFLVIGAVLLDMQLINIGQFVAAEIVIFIIMGSVEKLILGIDVVFDVLTAIEKMNKLLLKPIERQEGIVIGHSNPLNVEFKNVSFHYQEYNSVLKDLNFSLNSGSRLCIFGKVSGAGASTVLKLISGSHKPTRGEIYIDHFPISHFGLTEFRDRMSYMIGTPEIFAGTLWDNIAVGRKDLGMNQVMQLVEILGFHDVIQNLPMGFDTVLFTRGIKLPAHTIRKIILLRTLLHPGQLLMLDDPFRDLSDEHIVNLVSYLKKLPTTLIIAGWHPLAESLFDKTILLPDSSKLQ